MGELLIDSDAYRQLAKNTEEISRLLKENESILRENGFNPPKDNICFSKDLGITFPSKYIRNADSFRLKYHLKEIIMKDEDDTDGEAIASNCAYALCLSDVHNYLINRFNFWGIVKSRIFRDGIVNIVSIT